MTSASWALTFIFAFLWSALVVVALGILVGVLAEIAKATLMRRRSWKNAELRPDWWERFEDEFHAYARVQARMQDRTRRSE